MGGLRTGSDGVLVFSVDVPRDGTYDVSVFANSYNLADAVREQGPTNVFLRVDGSHPQELRLPLGYKWAVGPHRHTGRADHAALTRSPSPRRTMTSASRGATR